MALRTLLAPLARTAALALRHSAPATTRLQQVRLASSNKNKWVAPDNLRKWAFNMSGFNQYGLYYNDCFNEEHDDDVKEALRRLPPELLDERAFRIQRAMHLSMKHIVLPKDQWPTWEEDQAKGRYLQPYLEEVIAEREEREKWDTQ